MRNYNLGYISDENLYNHVKETILQYSETLKAIDLRKFNSNIVDPIKLTFDRKVYGKSIEEVIIEEISRQRDKTNNNAIGYFHQNLFKYIDNCVVPSQGWDVIVNKGDYSIYVEMKNKHNTMNSSSSAKTFMKMQNCVLNETRNYCYLVEIIAKQSQNTNWNVSIDGVQLSHEHVRRVSIDQFYKIVTGKENAFRDLCRVLTVVIGDVLATLNDLQKEEDTVIQELKSINPMLTKSIFLLAFSTYEGFDTF